MNKQIYFFLGTTAELIKLSQVLHELKEKRVAYKIITSGQNFVNFKEVERLTGKENVHYSFDLKPIRLPLPPPIHFLLWAFRSLFAYFTYFKKEFKSLKKERVDFIA